MFCPQAYGLMSQELLAREYVDFLDKKAGIRYAETAWCEKQGSLKGLREASRRRVRWSFVAAWMISLPMREYAS